MPFSLKADSIRWWVDAWFRGSHSWKQSWTVDTLLYINVINDYLLALLANTRFFFSFSRNLQGRKSY